VKKCYVVTVKPLSYRWSALLSLALVAWLWLAAVHVHVDADTSASHPVCELCAGLDRAAAPPPATLPVLLPQVGLIAALTPTATAVTARAPAHYSSRAPPQA
jgi:hypothetical protein